MQIYVCQLGKGQVELDEQKCDLETAHLTEYTLHLGTAEAAARQLSHVSADFPVVHPDRVSAMAIWGESGVGVVPPGRVRAIG